MRRDEVGQLRFCPGWRYADVAYVEIQIRRTGVDPIRPFEPKRHWHQTLVQRRQEGRAYCQIRADGIIRFPVAKARIVEQQELRDVYEGGRSFPC